MANYYYNNATQDGQWSTLGNWWLDSEFTVSAQTLPTSADSFQMFTEAVDASGLDLTGFDLNGTSLSYSNFSGTNLTNVNFQNSSLNNATFANANLTNANLANAQLTDSNFSDADLTNANLSNTYLVGVVLNGAILTGTILTSTDFTGVDLTGVDLSGVNTEAAIGLPDGYFGNTYFLYGQPTSLDSNGNGSWNSFYFIGGVETALTVDGNGFWNGDYYISGEIQEPFTGVYDGTYYVNNLQTSLDVNGNGFDGLNYNAYFIGGVQTGLNYLGNGKYNGDFYFNGEAVVSTVGVNFNNTDFTNLDLSDLDFTGSNFSGTDFSNVNLTNTNLSGANLGDTFLGGTDLSNTNLTDADLTNASFGDANYFNNTNLTNANFTNCVFPSYTSLGSSSFTGANFTNAIMDYVYFTDGSILSENQLSGTTFSNTSLIGAYGFPTGYWGNSYFVDGNYTTLDGEGNGFDYSYYYAYFIGGVQTTLDESGSGVWDGNNYENGVIVISAKNGWIDGIYYINDLVTTLNSSGNGTWNGVTYISGVREDGLLVFYKLDDLTDSSGNGNTLTNNGGVTFSSGKIGNAAVFDGTNSLRNESLFNFSYSDVTVSLWVKFNSIEGEQVMWAADNGNMFIINGGQLCWTPAYFSGISNRAFDESNTNYVAVDQWQHCVGRWNEQTSEWSMFLNGNKITFSDSGTLGTFTAEKMAVGMGYADGVNPFGFTNGQIDAVGIWNRALSDAEIAALYNSGTGYEISAGSPTQSFIKIQDNVKFFGKVKFVS